MPRFHAMFVHAHPDDESSKGAATMARYAKEGHRVSVVTLTDGMAGDILNPAMDQPGVLERMPEIRAEEIRRALDVIGVTDHFPFGYPDSGFVEGFDGDGALLADEAFFNVEFDAVLERLVRLVRAERPHVLVTYPEGGGYPHPDHIRCHDVAVAAFDAAADAARFPEAGPAWEVAKLYYVTVSNREKVESLHAACLEREIESPFIGWLERMDPDEPDPSTTRIEVADFIDQARRALLAHETQIDPNGKWFAVPEDVVREVYPYECFELGRSRVATSPPEQSLFEGI